MRLRAPSSAGLAECRAQPRLPGQAVFGIVQGGNHPALREECARALVENGLRRLRHWRGQRGGA